MTETIAYIKKSLDTCYPPNEISSLVRLIMEDVCGILPHQLLLGKGKELSDTEKEQVKQITERLKKAEPIQYILGEALFYGLTFRVTPAVLIPRPETEELVELILRDCKGSKARLLDIGTGSGCIAVALACHLKEAQVHALDISPEALVIAKENARSNQVTISFQEADILSIRENPFGQKFNTIVSNPPYITEREKADMEPNVLTHEPHLALFVPNDDPLLYYRAIARLGKTWLQTDGSLYFEINAQYGSQTAKMLEAEGYHAIEIIQDISHKERIVKARI